MSPDVPATEPDSSTLLAMRRTGMSFQRTRMSADRTLMSVIRTSISLISFGFTISQFFAKLMKAEMLGGDQSAPRNFGLALVWLGIGMLVLGIAYQIQFMRGLRHLRAEMKAEGLIFGESHFPASMTLLVAFALLAVGILAMLSLQLHVGPFG